MKIYNDINNLLHSPYEEAFIKLFNKFILPIIKFIIAFSIFIILSITVVAIALIMLSTIIDHPLIMMFIVSIEIVTILVILVNPQLLVESIYKIKELVYNCIIKEKRKNEIKRSSIIKH